MALPTCKTTRDPALHTCPPMTGQPGKMDDNTTAAPGIATLWDKQSGLSRKGHFRLGEGWETGVAAPRGLSCDCGSTAQRPPCRLQAPAGREGGLCSAGSWPAEPEKQGLAHGSRAPKDGLLYASGVLCRDSLANRDKL